MDERYCPECGYQMILESDGKALWCPICDTIEEIKEDEE